MDAQLRCCPGFSSIGCAEGDFVHFPDISLQTVNDLFKLPLPAGSLQ